MKHKPKYKVGDQIFWEATETTYKIIEVKYGEYALFGIRRNTHIGYFTTKSVDKTSRLLTKLEKTLN